MLKFGGTSLATPRRMTRVAALLRQASEEGPVVAVASALAEVTDLLSAAALGQVSASVLAAELWRRHQPFLGSLGSRIDGWAARQLRLRIEEARSLLLGRGSSTLEGAERDRLLATGERLSVPLLVAALSRLRCRAEPVDGTALLVTDDTSGRARVLEEASRRRIRQVMREIPRDVVPVVTGFIGADGAGRTTTLGRGGSDATATWLGAALEARQVEIWTDVDGVYSGPPALLSGAQPISRLSFADAAEMARLGASVLHESCIAPVARAGVPVRVLNTLRPTVEGTWIDGGPESEGPVGVAAVLEAVQLILEVREPARGWEVRRLKEVLARRKAMPLLAGESPGSLLWIVRPEEASEVLEAFHVLPGAGLEGRLDSRTVALVAVVGGAPGAYRQAALAALDAAGIAALAPSPGSRSQTLVVEPRHGIAALRRLHETLLSSAARISRPLPAGPAVRPRGSVGGVAGFP